MTTTAPPTEFDADAATAATTVTEQHDAARLSVRVVEAVADATDADPLAMPPLYDAIDPDALDALFGDGRSGRVAFTYDGHDVTVHADGTVAIDDAGAR